MHDLQLSDSTKTLLKNNGVKDLDQFINVVFDKLKDLGENSVLHKRITGLENKIDEFEGLEDQIRELEDRLDNATIEI